MKKILNYLACLFGILFLASTCVYAEDKATNEDLLFMEIPSVIGVSKKAENINETPMSVYVVTREEMKRWGIQSMYELYGRVPGYTFYDVDFHGSECPPARGLTSLWRYGFSYNLLPIFDPGHQTFVPSFYKSVEIARGPAGLAWGSAAEAGLTNFNLRDDLNGSEISAQYGSGGRRSYSYAFGAKLEGENNNIFIGYQREQQASKTTAVDSLGTNGQWHSFGLGEGTYTLHAAVNYNKFKFTMIKTEMLGLSRVTQLGQSATSTNIFENALRAQIGPLYQHMETTGYRIEYNALKTEDLNLSVYHDFADKIFWVEYFFQSRQQQKDYGFNGSWTGMNKKLDLNFGGNLLTQYAGDAPAWQTAYMTDTWGWNSRKNKKIVEERPARDFFVQGAYKWSDQLTTILGMRMDYKQKSKPNEVIYSGPRFAVIYKSSPDLTLKYMYNNSSRRPRGNELYSPDEVDAESLYSHDLAAIWEPSDKLRLETTLFYQAMPTAIHRDPLLMTRYFNGEGITAYGLETALKYKPEENTWIYWNSTIINAKAVENTVSGNVVKLASDDDLNILFTPGISSFLGVEYDAMKMAYINVGLRSYLNIPYKKVDNDYDFISTHFIDITVRSHKLYDNSVELSLIALNALDNQDDLPVLGEHAGNAKGTVPPKERRLIAQITYNFQ